MGDKRTAACLAVGSELLGDHRLDSNSLTVTHALTRHGITVEEKRVAGDSVERVADAIRELEHLGPGDGHRLECLLAREARPDGQRRRTQEKARVRDVVVRVQGHAHPCIVQHLAQF